jgi:hypothetical protein
MKTKIIMMMMLALMGLSATHAQVGIGTTTPDTSSILHLEANDKGFLPPRMSTADRDNIVNPTNALLIYNTSDACYQFYLEATDNWFCIESKAPQQPRVAIFEKSNAQVVTTPFTAVTLDFQPGQEVFNNIGTMNTNSEFIVTDAGYYRLTVKGGFSGDVTTGTTPNPVLANTVSTDYFFESSTDGATWSTVGGDRVEYTSGVAFLRESFFSQYIVPLNAGDRIRVRNQPNDIDPTRANWTSGGQVEICGPMNRFGSKPALLSIEFLGVL